MDFLEKLANLILILCSFIKKVLNIHTPTPPTEMNLKGVYVINYGWYVQQYDPVCVYMKFIRTKI